MKLTRTQPFHFHFTALPQIKSLATDPAYKKHFHLLELFAHGTYADYKQDTSKFPPSLHPLIISKLKMLTVVTLAASNKYLNYALLMDCLDLGDVRELEDLLIECIYAGIMVGRLDQQSSQLKVERVSGRDPSAVDIVNMCDKLEQWGLAVENMIEHVENKAVQATDEFNTQKMKDLALIDAVDTMKSKRKAQMSGASKQAGSSGWAAAATDGGGVMGGMGGMGGMGMGGSDDSMAAVLQASKMDF